MPCLPIVAFQCFDDYPLELSTCARYCRSIDIDVSKDEQICADYKHLPIFLGAGSKARVYHMWRVFDVVVLRTTRDAIATKSVDARGGWGLGVGCA